MSTHSLPVYAQRDGFDPSAALRRLRDEAPVTKVAVSTDEYTWMVTGYAEVRVVLGDPITYSNREPTDEPAQRAAVNPRPGDLTTYDPPDHTRLRRMLVEEFSPARQRQLRPRVEAVIAEHLDLLLAAGPPADLISTFASPVPSSVICELLGVADAERDELHANTRVRLDFTAAVDHRIAAVQSSRDHLAELVATQRHAPGDNLIGRLIRAHGDEIDDDELIGLADLLLLAGHETTAHMLGIGTLVLLRHPDQIALVRDPATAGTAIEELVRYLSVAQTSAPRTTTMDVVLGGTVIPAGSEVICSLPLANRDPVLNAGQPRRGDLDHLDLTRRSTNHVGFGYGIHYCVGAPLARMELQLCYRALFDRLPGLRLAAPLSDLAFRTDGPVFGLDCLPVTW